MLLKVMFNGTPRLLPRNKAEILFSPFLVSTVVKLFICFAGSHSRLLMADVALLVYITGWAALDIFTNLAYDEDFKENNLPRFPFSPATVNLWFRQAVQPGGHTLRRIINMLNLRKRPEPNDYPNLDNDVFPTREEDVEGFTMLYHGTRAHNYADSILHGINLYECGKKAGDFSHLMGFYVTKNFESAEKVYAGLEKKNCAIQSAVLAFKIPDDVLERFREGSLDLRGENKARWVDTVKNIKDESKKYSFIEGPEMKREPDGEKTYEQLPDTHQMCILDKKMAKAFDEHLHAVVFYDIPGVEATEVQP